MPLRLQDRWIWDFWLARDGEDYHVFYLQAPRSLGDPELRHFNTSIGHAVSRDLREWRPLPDALHSGPPGVWDDGAVWTGCVIQHEDIWHMLYTGVHIDQEGLIEQRVGLATSTDLTSWRKHPENPLIEADPRYYSQRDPGTLGPERVWRDPWVFRHPQTEDFHALITASVSEGPSEGCGVVAHARSDDLVSW